MTTHAISAPGAITAALSCPALTPPPRDGSGVAAQLRASMARFSPLADHARRRTAVEAVIASVDVDDVARGAARMTCPALGDDTDVVALAHHVPAAALASTLGLVPNASLGELVHDVREVVAVIGRGAVWSANADAAAQRLLAVAGRSPWDAVAVVSVLYQTVDATAALVLTTLHAHATGQARVAAVPRTVRIATRPVRWPGGAADAGDEVVLALGAAGLEFGRGPHRCPGRALAERLAAAVVEPVLATHQVDVGSVELDADGRPVALRVLRARRGDDTAPRR